MHGLQPEGELQPEHGESEPPGQIAEPAILILVAESVGVSLAGRHARCHLVILRLHDITLHVGNADTTAFRAKPGLQPGSVRESSAGPQVSHSRCVARVLPRCSAPGCRTFDGTETQRRTSDAWSARCARRLSCAVAGSANCKSPGPLIPIHIKGRFIATHRGANCVYYSQVT